jgi:HK97 gp10 family phage protein
MTDFSGLEDLADDLERFADDVGDVETQIEATLDQAVEKTSLRVERRAKQTVPIDTGTLRNSIKQRQVDTAQYAVGTNVEYGRYVEFGTSGHTVTPNDDDGVLVFQAGGETVFAKRAEIPPRDPNPYLRPALRDSEDDLASDIREAIRELFAEVLE